MNAKKFSTIAAMLLLSAATSFAQAADEPVMGPAPEVPSAAPTMSLPRAAVLGAVEGITEFLPVSSTGHLLIVERLFGSAGSAGEKDASDAYAIVIQLGAILAVFLVSFGTIRRMILGIFGKDRKGLQLAGYLVVSFVPAAVIGLIFEDWLKQYLFDPWHVAIAWLVGGIFILAVMRKKGSEGGLAAEDLGWRKALVIGLIQCFALWPGVSRSLATMAGGMLLGLSVSAAVEYSFLLGLVTLGAATIYEGIRNGHQIVQYFGVVSPLVGLLVAAVTAFIAVKWMVSYLRNRSPAVFGWYRIAIGAAVTILIIGGKL
jgi:undecaprenyl-diphosphatase